ncbi:MAG: hypothetical protein WC511_03065 [Candidatus Pacearchaeota archaeon]
MKQKLPGRKMCSFIRVQKYLYGEIYTCCQFPAKNGKQFCGKHLKEEKKVLNK